MINNNNFHKGFLNKFESNKLVSMKLPLLLNN